MVPNCFVARAKKLLWLSSLCHSLVRYTYVDLSLRYKFKNNSRTLYTKTNN